jgi:hypothetical protein
MSESCSSGGGGSYQKRWEMPSALTITNILSVAVFLFVLAALIKGGFFEYIKGVL